MKKISGFYFLLFSSYWENGSTFGLFAWDTYCTASTIGVIKYLGGEKKLGRAVAHDPEVVRGFKSWRKVLQKLDEILQKFWKIRKFAASFQKLGDLWPSLRRMDPV
jgi:hypothetical protein